MSDDRNEALRLADRISPETDWYEFDQVTWCNEAAALLRQQAERIAELEGRVHTCGPTCSKAGCINRRVTAERDQLRIDLDDELCNREVLDTMLTQCIAERDKLLAEVERYRHLRSGQSWPAVFASHDAPEPLRGDELDTAIDHARTTHKDEG